MKIKVRTIALLKSLLGQGDLELDLPPGATVGDLLSQVAGMGGEELARYLAEPKEATPYAPLRVMVNGRDIVALEGRQTVLNDGDEVLFFIPIAGG